LRFHQLLLLFLVTSTQQAYGDERYRSFLEDMFAGAIILSDSDVFTVGFKDFDPNQYLNIDNEDIGSSEALDLRKSFDVTTLPWSVELEADEYNISRSVVFRFSALNARGDIVKIPNETPDQHDEWIYGGFIGYEQKIPITQHWSFVTGLGAHVQYYQSSYSYNSALTQEYLRPVIDGLLVNTSAWAAVWQPKLKFQYDKPVGWGEWKLASTYNYYTGTAWGQANNGNVGAPEGWYFSNEVKLFFDVTRWGRAVQTLYTSARRVDIGGNSIDVFNTANYYEASVGWLMSPPFKTDLFENVGLGLTVNYGSALKGGSLVLFFNQE
jgi:hypothetical protein